MITTHIWFNVSRCKGNQTMKLVQSIEYNMKSVFREKPLTKCDGEPIFRPFCCWTTKYIETTVWTTCFYLIQSFLKKREGFWK